jgi:hypothetical protein
MKVLPVKISPGYYLVIEWVNLGPVGLKLKPGYPNRKDHCYYQYGNNG